MTSPRPILPPIPNPPPPLPHPHPYLKVWTSHCNWTNKISLTFGILFEDTECLITPTPQCNGMQQQQLQRALFA